jgi:hypothetical protein
MGDERRKEEDIVDLKWAGNGRGCVRVLTCESEGNDGNYYKVVVKSLLRVIIPHHHPSDNNSLTLQAPAPKKKISSNLLLSKPLKMSNQNSNSGY